MFWYSSPPKLVNHFTWLEAWSNPQKGLSALLSLNYCARSRFQQNIVLSIKWLVFIWFSKMSTSQHLRGLTFTNLLSSSFKGFGRLTFNRKTTLHVSASQACFLNLWAALRDAHCTQASRAELWSIMGNGSSCDQQGRPPHPSDTIRSLWQGCITSRRPVRFQGYICNLTLYVILPSPLVCARFHELPSTTLSFSGEAAYCWVCTRREFLRNMWKNSMGSWLKAIRFQHSRNLW